MEFYIHSLLEADCQDWRLPSVPFKNNYCYDYDYR